MNHSDDGSFSTLQILSSKKATDSSDASFVVQGGAGIRKNLIVGEDVTVYGKIINKYIDDVLNNLAKHINDIINEVQNIKDDTTITLQKEISSMKDIFSMYKGHTTESLSNLTTLLEKSIVRDEDNEKKYFTKSLVPTKESVLNIGSETERWLAIYGLLIDSTKIVTDMIQTKGLDVAGEISLGFASDGNPLMTIQKDRPDTIIIDGTIDFIGGKVSKDEIVTTQIETKMMSVKPQILQLVSTEVKCIIESSIIFVLATGNVIIHPNYTLLTPFMIIKFIMKSGTSICISDDDMNSYLRDKNDFVEFMVYDGHLEYLSGIKPKKIDN